MQQSAGTRRRSANAEQTVSAFFGFCGIRELETDDRLHRSLVQCSCQNVTALAPVASDCQSLISSLSVVAQATGASFTVEPDNFELLSFATCALEWTNTGCETLEYCWDELASTAGVVNQLCFEQGGGTAAACPADDDQWLFQCVLQFLTLLYT